MRLHILQGGGEGDEAPGREHKYKILFIFLLFRVWTSFSTSRIRSCKNCFKIFDMLIYSRSYRHFNFKQEIIHYSSFLHFWPCNYVREAHLQLDRIVLHGKFALITLRGNFWYQINQNRKQNFCSRANCTHGAYY